MPTYQDLYCEGACERLGHRCIKPDLFVRLAEEHEATPKQISGKFQYADENGRSQVGRWKYHALDVQGEQRSDLLQQIADRLHEQAPEGLHETAETLLNVAEQSFLQEFPCHVECDITICGHCGRQHEDRGITPEGCPYMT
jgi:hypothetical protein